jgi:integrase
LKAAFSRALDRGIIEATPIVGVKRRTKSKERARKRWLPEPEIKAVWTATDQLGYPFGPFVKMLLLTGQRRSEVACMRWDEIAGDVWTIPPTKTKNKQQHEVPLSQAAMQLIANIPNTGDFVFMSGRSKAGNPISGFSKAKTYLDDHIRSDGSELDQWGFHDLRRTVRTHMSRIGVTSAVAERVLNHTPQGVEAIYDRHGYLDEKRMALEAWSNAISYSLTGNADGAIVKFERTQNTRM